VVNIRKRKILLILLPLILIIALWLSFPFFLTKIGECLIINEGLNKVDIIIVLSGDDEGQRLRHAFHLYRKGYARKILLSGGTNLWEETGIDLMERYLIQLGVSQEDIISEKLSESTVENASFSLRLLEERRVKSAIVVTSPTHTRRVSIIFKKIFSPKMEVSVSSDPHAFQVEGWWRNQRDRRVVIREYFQISWYLLFGD